MARRTSASAAQKGTASKAKDKAKEMTQSLLPPGVCWGSDDDMDFCPARRDDGIEEDDDAPPPDDYQPAPYTIDDEPYIIFD